MSLLPNRYIPCNQLGGLNIYFDTGYSPTGNTNVCGLFYHSITTGGTWIFGSRYSQSNTSVGQINAYSEWNSGNPRTWIGYASNRVQATISAYFQVKNDGNAIEMIGSGTVEDLTGNISAFTNSRPMYILAVNNGGALLYGTQGNNTVCVCEFAIWESGTEVHHYIPVYDRIDDTYGLYDIVASSFVSKSGTGTTFYEQVMLEAQSTTGGEAWIVNDTIGYTKKKSLQKNTMTIYERLVAVANPGYEFLYWTDQGDNIVSYETEYHCTPGTGYTSDMVFTAHFVKKTKDVQFNQYQLLGLQYGVGVITSSSPDGHESDIYAKVKSFTCNVDALSSTTSTIELESLPSLYQTKIPVFLFNPKGKMLWCGVISSINGNTLTCREPLSIFDTEIIFNTLSASDKKRSVQNGIFYLIQEPLTAGDGTTDILLTPNINVGLKKYFNTFTDVYHGSHLDGIIIFGQTGYAMPTFPTGVQNAEQYMLNMTDQYGVIYETTLWDHTNSSYPNKGIKHLANIKIVNAYKYTPLQFGSNSEAITNIEIQEQEECANTLMIYNSAGTSQRGIYGVKTDGSIADITNLYPLTSDYLAYTNCVNKIVASDDPIKSLIRENLGNAMLNHKITFDVDLQSEMYSFDDFKIGRRVKFYNGDKLYSSMITGLSFEGTNNDILTIKVTLGNVRTKLVTKLNIGKGK